MTRFVKNFTLGIGLMTALAFVSCDRGGGSVEDDKKFLTDNYFSGKKYKILARTIFYDKGYVLENYAINGCTSNNSIEFKKDGTGQEEEYKELDKNCYSDIYKFLWKLDENNQLVLSYNELLYYSISRTENDYLDLEGYEDYDGDGKTELVKIELKRQ
ncbi:hypothetical protein ACFFUE_08115 [Bergeyella porcorum]|uniref:hypothetical protein n=1 Tax=Bergeyella porcorum TaxID=1735111 RepID=UPI0035E84B81